MALASGYLFVVPWELREFGGVDQVVINLRAQMEQRGEFSPVVLTNSWNAGEPKLSKDNGRISIHLRLRTPLFRGRLTLSLLTYTLTLPNTLRVLRSLVHMYNVQIINVHYPSLSAVSFLILKSLRLFHGRLILSMHGSEVRHAKLSQGLERRVWRTLIRKADAVVACSRWLETEIRRFVPEAKNLTYIYNGVDPEYMKNEKEIGFSIAPSLADKRLIVSVANFEHKKGQDVLIRAFCEVRTTHADVHLVLIGAATKYLRDLEAEAHRCGVREHVSFIPDLPHRRISAYLEKAYLFVLASRQEPFGIAILEAGLHRLAVVASAVGGIPEILDHNVTGLLVPPDDSAALAHGIGRLLREPDMRSSLAIRLYHHVLRDFSWQRAYEQYIAVVRQR